MPPEKNVNHSTSRVSTSTTGNLNNDSNAFNADDPLFYTRVRQKSNEGSFKKSLDSNLTTESSTLLNSESITTNTLSKNWYKNLEKFEKSRHSVKNHNPQLKIIEESHLKKDMESDSEESDSGESPCRRKKINLRNVLKYDAHGSTPLRNALEDESSTSKVTLEESGKRKSISKSSFDKTNTSKNNDSKTNDSEKFFRMRKSKKFSKIRNISGKSSENVFRKFFDEESSDSESTICDVRNQSNQEELDISRFNCKVLSPSKQLNTRSLNKSSESEKQMSNQQSSFIEEPQYESTRKIDAKKLSQRSRRSEAIRELKLSNIGIIDEDDRLFEIDSSKPKVLKPENVDKMNFPKIGSNSLTDSQNFQTSDYRSKRSPTVSLSEGYSSENEAPLKNSVKKPKIVKYEILQPNDIDVNKLKGNKLHSQKLQLNDSGIGNNSRKTFLRHPEVSNIEEEFSRMHGIEDEQVPSTSDGRIQNSRNFQQGKSITSKSMHRSSSLRVLRRTMESDDSDFSDQENISYYASKETSSNISPTSSVNQNKKQKVQKSVEENNEHMETTTHDFIKTSAKKKVSPVKKPVENVKLMSVSEVFNDKKKLEAFLKRCEESKAQIQKKVDDKKMKESLDQRVVKPIQNKKKKPPKPVNPVYLVNGRVYKQPKLPRPMLWASDNLYKHIMKKIEPKYGIKTRVQAGKIVTHLSDVVKKVLKLKLFKNYEEDLDKLMRHMAEMEIIVTYKDFFDFCNEFLPISFREKAVPMIILGTNKMNIPFDSSKLYTPIEF